MAQSLPTPCSHPTCPATSEDRFCGEHRSMRWNDDRPNFRERGYDSRWTRVSDRYRKKHPICEGCGDKPSELVHHITPVDEGGRLLLADNLKALCRPCHAKEHAHG